VGEHADEIDLGSAAVELRLAVKRLQARLRAESASSEGWTISQLSTLSRIIARGPITASALAQVEHVRPQSIAEIVATLKTGGLVTSTPDPTDGRKALLAATPRGRELIESVSASREAWLTRAIDAVVPPARRQALAEAIDLLNELAGSEVPAAHAGGRYG
jgi:DNA-binding MarR family transcriptional regulator